MQEDLPAESAIRFDETPSLRQPVRRGSLCPRCGVDVLDYNGLLELECPHCGYAEGGGIGCT